MKKLTKTSLAVATLLATTAVSATTINLRHEYIDRDDADYSHADRISVSHRFSNGIGFSAEAKWRYQDNDKQKGLINNGHEVGVSYNHKLNDTFTLQPSYAADASNNANQVTHKFNIRGIAKITDEWTTSLRYRYGYQAKANRADSNGHYHQYNLVSSYNLGWSSFGVDLEYKDLQSGGWKNKGSDHLVNFFGEYKGLESGWVPFAELGVITTKDDGSAYKEDYTLRYRVGVKYSF